MKNFLKLSIFFVLVSALFFTKVNAAGEQQDLLKVDWSFKSFFGKFDRASLQRGYQVYTEVCASCHSLKHLSYRNLAEKGGPEFTEAEAKAIASNFEVTDGLEIGSSIKISSIKLSENVTPTIQGRDFVIATVAAPTVVKEPEKPAEEAEGEAAADGAETSSTEGEEKSTGETDKGEADKAKKEEDKSPAEKK